MFSLYCLLPLLLSLPSSRAAHTDLSRRYFISGYFYGKTLRQPDELHRTILKTKIPWRIKCQSQKPPQALLLLAQWLLQFRLFRQLHQHSPKKVRQKNASAFLLQEKMTAPRAQAQLVQAPPRLTIKATLGRSFQQAYAKTLNSGPK
ncbi:MAG: hypothetical protein ACJAZW_002705 [Maritalea sp.]|jgi:hypothetical protein